MKGKLRKLIIFLIWLLVIVSGPITVVRNTNLPELSSNFLFLVNFFQRFTGLIGFSLIFVQILLGAFMRKWEQILGKKAFKLHVAQGLLAYGFIFIHPLIQAYFNFLDRGLFGAFLTYLPGREIYLNLGKFAFLFISLAVIAAYFREKPFLKRHWRKFHALNYLAFYFVAVHSGNLGSDVSVLPFSLVHKTALAIVSAIVVYRAVKLLTFGKGKVKIRRK